MQDAPELPEPGRLRSPDPEENRKAWDDAFPILRSYGMKIANARIAGPDREHDRGDIVQTAMIQLCQGLMGAKGEESIPESFRKVETTDHLLNLFATIVRARITDFYRKAGRRRQEIGDESGDMAIAEALSSNTPSDLGIWSFVERLKPPKPELFEARFYLGYTTDEIAERFQMSRNTVLSHWRRGLIALRKMLEEEGIHHG